MTVRSRGLAAIAVAALTISAVRAQDTKSPLATLPFLIGAYDNAYYDISQHPGEKLHLRFFAARFRGNLSQVSTIQRQAAKAASAVDWNSTSLTPQGVLGREFIRDDEGFVVGAYCPRCQDTHWVAVGLSDDNKKTYQICTNSLDETSHEPAMPRGWVRKTLSDTSQFWYAPLEQGGWHQETFRDTRGQQARQKQALEKKKKDQPKGAPKGLSPCNFEISVGLTPAGDFAFSFSAKDPTTMRLVGTYEDKRLSPRTQPTQIYDEQIQYYAVVVSGIWPDNINGNFRAFHQLVGDAADFGRDMVRRQGKTLANPSALKRQRLAADKFLVLGIYNASRDENRWFAFRFNNGTPEVTRGSARSVLPGNGPLPSWETVETGGFKVELHTLVHPEDKTVEYLFLMPR